MFLMAGCSNTPDAEQQAKDDEVYSSDYKNYADNSKVATINLADDGSVESIEIGNQNLQPPQRKQYQDSFAQTLVKEGFKTVRAIGGSPTTALAATAILTAREMGKSAGHNTTITNSQNSHSEANQANSHSEANQANSSVTNTATTNNTNSYNQTTESHNQSEQNPVTNTDNTNNSVSDSNNSQTTQQPPATENQEEGGS